MSLFKWDELKSSRCAGRLWACQAGFVGCWLVKDLSHFGRDYLTVGQYTDIIFPSYDVRFIAINDGVDSSRGDTRLRRNP